MIPINECNVSGIADMRDGLDERLENRSFEWSKAFWTLQEIGGSDATETSCGATRAEVVLCGLFTTSKSLESLRAQNVKSPLSAIFVPERLSCIDFLERQGRKSVCG
jgi:hypothetical protein